MSGKLFVIEGVDGSGKATQTVKLYEHLKAQGHKVEKVSFPNYDSPSSGLIKMYLNGDFGSTADAVNPYVASTFYAVDRFASFRQNWQSFYEQGGILLADRYTTSNMIHQGCKIGDPLLRRAFFDWLMDFEYGLFGLPKPTCTIFLDMPPVFSAQLRQERLALAKDLQQDIHEQDQDYLLSVYQTSLEVAQTYDWRIISCLKAEKIRTVEDIHHEIQTNIGEYL